MKIDNEPKDQADAERGGSGSMPVKQDGTVNSLARKIHVKQDGTVNSLARKIHPPPDFLRSSLSSFFQP